VITPQVAMDMNMMMSRWSRKAPPAAPSSTASSPPQDRDHQCLSRRLFVGFTGNFICGVWFGNDDYTVMNQMTGGSLPAQTWHEIMAYAHQGVELKAIPGLGPQATGRQQVAESKDGKKGRRRCRTAPAVDGVDQARYRCAGAGRTADG